jgi:GNAT superfamily N-acetyltransferase
MRSQHIAMTIEEFEVMPRKLGWKYEYWDGQAHISPRHHAVTTSVEIRPRPIKAPCKLRAVEQKDEARLISGYIAAFKDTIEYCDRAPEKITTSARKAIQGFFADKRGKPLSSSRLAAVSQSGIGNEAVIGAALLVEKDSQEPLLDILFVIPEWQRQGVATALASAAINELYNVGVKTLKSRYFLGNNDSRAWHQKFGFVEEPDLYLARLYYHQAKHELWRRENIGNLTEIKREALLSEIDQWQARVDELEKIAKQEGWEAVFPLSEK